MDSKDRSRAMILGAFVADAAAMGTHWIYDQDRLRAIAPDTPEFQEPDGANYEGVPGYFAHPTRTAGDLSHYGAQLMVMLRALAAAPGYDRATYEQEFATYFGYGSAYVGYIDRPTRATLNTMAARSDDATTTGFAGADDVQLPAISKLPALVAALHGADNLSEAVEDAVRVTNNSDVAVSFAQAAQSVLNAVLTDGVLPELADVAADDVVAKALAPALSRLTDPTEDVTGDIGMSCQLSYGVPSVLHNVANGPGFCKAVRTNILAGGDTCGRAILLGAILGGLHGIGGEAGIPEAWISKLNDRVEIEELITQVVS